MPSCEFSLRLEPPPVDAAPEPVQFSPSGSRTAYRTTALEAPARPAVYQTGEPVRGTVEAQVHESTHCRSLRVECGWHTEGRGNPAKGLAESVKLFAGEWAPGSYAYEFTLPGIGGPLSYRGSYLSVQWTARVHADLYGQRHEAPQQPFMLIPGNAPVSYNLGPAYQSSEARWEHEAGGRWNLLGRIGADLGQLLVAVAFLLMGLVVGEPAMWFLSVLVAAALLIAAPFVLVPAVLTLVARSRAGPVDVDLEPRRVQAGAELRCRIRYAARGTIVPRASVTLLARERVWYDDNDDYNPRRELTTVIYREQAPLRRAVEDTPSDRQELVAVLRVPADGPQTFRAKDNELAWICAVELSLPGWPDWKREYPVTVLPPVLLPQ
ncbi:MAG: hypothetical protein HYX51_02000 [Chloroflexi bacterium]|nr:hypothetical protein [Chloroflexota bacterium]